MPVQTDSQDRHGKHTEKLFKILMQITSQSVQRDRGILVLGGNN